VREASPVHAPHHHAPAQGRQPDRVVGDVLAISSAARSPMLGVLRDSSADINPTESHGTQGNRRFARSDPPESTRRSRRSTAIDQTRLRIFCNAAVARDDRYEAPSLGVDRHAIAPADSQHPAPPGHDYRRTVVEYFFAHDARQPRGDENVDDEVRVARRPRDLGSGGQDWSPSIPYAPTKLIGAARHVPRTSPSRRKGWQGTHSGGSSGAASNFLAMLSHELPKNTRWPRTERQKAARRGGERWGAAGGGRRHARKPGPVVERQARHMTSAARRPASRTCLAHYPRRIRDAAPNHPRSARTRRWAAIEALQPVDGRAGVPIYGHLVAGADRRRRGEASSGSRANLLSKRRPSTRPRPAPRSRFELPREGANAVVRGE